MKAIFIFLAAALSVSQCSNAGTINIPSKDMPQFHDRRVVPGMHIVEFSEPADVRTGKSQKIHEDITHEHKLFRRGLKAAGIKHKEHQVYKRLLNAVTINLSNPEDVKKLKDFSTVKNIWPVLEVDRPRPIDDHKSTTRTDRTVKQTLANAHNMTGVRQLHETTKFDGKGLKVCVVDSGIDYTHPAFGGCYGPGCRVAFGHDFVGPLYDGASPREEGDDPLDCGGHGTHVAGIIGARDKLHNFTGVAPEVTFGAYKIFGCTGGTRNTITIQALEKTLEDGCDIVNLSIGGGTSWAYDLTSTVIDKLTAAGVLVVSAIGNEGVDGLFTSSTPGTASNGLGVGSIENTHRNHFELSVAGIKMPYGSLSERAIELRKEIIVPTSLNTTIEDDSCTEVPANVAGKVALIRRGECILMDKITNAVNAGAIGVVLYNNLPDPIWTVRFPVQVDNRTIPVATISETNGRRIVDISRKKRKMRITFKDTMVALPVPQGGRPSDFSSWGTDPELNINPDISAPGGNIFSTYPVKKGSYKTMSGTSMATPYITGVAALYMQATGMFANPLAVRRALMNTAIPTLMEGEVVADSTIKQGAGVVNVLAALKPHASITPSKLSFQITPDPLVAHHRAFMVSNDGDSELAYRILHVPAQAVSQYNSSGYFKFESNAVETLDTNGASVKFAVKTVRLQPGRKTNVHVFLNAPVDIPLAKKGIYSGYFLLDPISPSSADVPPIRVPYVGWKASADDIPVLDFGSTLVNGAKPGPAITRKISNETMEVIQRDKEGSDLQPFWNFRAMKDKPEILLRLAYGTQSVDVKWIDKSGKDIGFAACSRVLSGRNVLAEQPLTVMGIGGVVYGDMFGAKNTTLPAGEYRLRIRTTKAFTPYRTYGLTNAALWQSSLITVV